MNVYIQRFLKEISADISANSLRTYDHRMRAFSAFIGDRPMISLDTKLVGEYRRHSLDVLKLCNRSVRYDTKLIKRFIAWGVDNGLCLAPVKMKALPRLLVAPPNKLTFTPDQYASLRQAAHTGRCKDYWPALIVIGYWTGMRLSDAAQLEWTEVDLVDRVLMYVPQKTVRYNKRVILPMEDELYDVLEKIRPAKKPFLGEENYLIPDAARVYKTQPTNLNGQFGRLCRRAGLPDHTFHCFRHTMVTRLLNAGVDSIIISDMVGMSVSEIKTYAHVSLDAKREAMEKARARLKTS